MKSLHPDIRTVLGRNLSSKGIRQSSAVYGQQLGSPASSCTHGHKRAEFFHTQSSRFLSQVSSGQTQPSWEDKLSDYQKLLRSCWKKASSIKRDEESDRASALREMETLERDFDKMTKILLCDLGLFLKNLDVNENGKGRGGSSVGVLLPRINVGAIFNAVSTNKNLPPLRVNTNKLLSLLNSKFGPYHVVKRLVNRTLSLGSIQGPWSIADTPEDVDTPPNIYLLLTAYLFYTSLTPQDIRGILSNPSVIDGCPLVDDALIKEYFSILLLYLEMCEADDDLRLDYAKSKKKLKEVLLLEEDSEDFFSRQSRRVLLGRLTSSLFLYNLNGGFGPGKVVTFEGGLTDEQLGVVKSDLAVGESLRVKAFAGTGKTMVLTQYAKARPEQKWLYLTFNNSVQKDAATKFGSNVVCRTIHSLTRETILKMRQGRELPESSGGDLTSQIIEILGLEDKEILRLAILDPSQKLPSAAKVARVINETLLTFFTSYEVEIDYASLHWMMADRLGLKKDVILEWTRRAWDKIQNLEGPHFPHDGYLKMVHLDGVGGRYREGLRCEADTLAFGQYDGIMFDEAQDADPVMAEIIFRQRPFSRIIVVGDPNQMIYEFRGTNNECFDADIYPVTHEKWLTYSFRFGLGIAAVAAHCLRATGEPLKMKAIGAVDILKAEFPRVVEVSDPLVIPTTINHLPPGAPSAGGSGKHTVIFRKNSSLVSALFSYCDSHPNHKLHLTVPAQLQPRALFPTLIEAHKLKRGIPADSGCLKGIRSMEHLMKIVGSETSDSAGAATRCRKLYDEVREDLEETLGAETKLALKAMTQKDKLKRQDKRLIQRFLKGNTTPNNEMFLQVLISKDVVPRMFPPELKVVAGVERQGLLSDQNFLEKIDRCSKMVVDDAKYADITLTTTHQAKGLEWDNVVMADDFAPLHMHRHNSGVKSFNLENVRIMYVASTRARKKLHVGQRTVSSQVSEYGSYRWFLSPAKEDCPTCQGEAPTGWGTCDHFIGYEAVMETAKFGSALVVNKTGKFPFGNKEDVIGCYKSTIHFYNSSLRSILASYNQPEYEAIAELKRVADTLEEVLGLASGTQDQTVCKQLSQRGGWVRKFNNMNIADEIRVGSWMRKHMMFSWGIFLELARMRSS